MINNKQKLAIHHYGTPLLIIAGAGSGKTTVITLKIQHLIQEMGFPGDSILAITFTNKAANEMQERVMQLINREEGTPKVSTFHAFCLECLFLYYARVGLEKNFIILDTSDQKRILKRISEALCLSETQYSIPFLMQQIETIKNNLIQIDRAGHGVDTKIVDVYTRYEAELQKLNAIDFGDMLKKTHELFKQNSDILDRIQSQYKYILVDEYQDTNIVQYQLVYLIARKYQNITVVGDFDQTIYSWRGAHSKNLIKFEADYKDVYTVTLDQNYRSTNTILKAANAIIQNNSNRKEKNLWTDNSEGEKISVFQARDEVEEARYLVKKCQKLKGKGTSYNDIAILYRMNALSRVIEEQLGKEGIPYRVIGSMKFFERKEIKDILAYLRVIHNKKDNEAFYRIINVPARAIGAVTIKHCETAAKEKGLSLLEVCQGEVPGCSAKAQKSLNDFARMIKALEMKVNQYTTDCVAQLIQQVVKVTGYKDFVEKEGVVGQDRLENIFELMSVSREEEGGIELFLAKIALNVSLDKTDMTTEAVTLMTLHNAKGLEYKYVFISGCEEGILPHYRSQTDPEQLEEERRLCYVGVTRGKKEVALTHCQQRQMFGESRLQKSSQFIEEIPETLLERHHETRAGSGSWLPNKSMKAPSVSYTTSTAQYKMGDVVIHKSWGQGQVTDLEGSGDGVVLHIQFGNQKKRVLAKYAPLEKQ